MTALSARNPGRRLPLPRAGRLSAVIRGATGSLPVYRNAFCSIAVGVPRRPPIPEGWQHG